MRRRAQAEWRRLFRASAVVAIAMTAPAAARAEPQWNAAAVAGGCILGTPQDAFEVAAFCGKLRADLLFLRERTSDYGAGPYLSLGTAAFDDLRGAAGLSVLLPVLEDFPAIVSVGGILTDEAQVGLDSSLFFGLRSYNFYGAYNFAGGGVLGFERTFGDGATTAVSIGAQIDGLILALPFLLAWGALQ